MTDLAKVYAPAEVEGRLYRLWEEAGYFRADPDPAREPFTIVIPPPNVTGALHLGHALDNTLQDILVRHRRMAGFAALWVPGTDHAGIATQNVVEKELAKEGKTRHDLGREAFVERVWRWKEEYGSRITGQLKRLGCSCDWRRERFTMDPGLSRAVRRVFVDLFDQGLIYRGNRIINWCPRCETALADIEVDHTEHAGELAQFRYPVEGGGEIAVATTRLETMLGDTAVAVHPEDPRYRDMVGRHALHPFTGRRMPVVADRAVDAAFGTGAVKITPAHDATDFEIAERHGLEKVNILDGRAVVNSGGGPFAGMDRYAAREAVRRALAEKGLLDGSTPHTYALGRCDRCGTVVEPWLSEQWFVRMQPLAGPAIAAAREGRVRFHPERWARYYTNWLEQIRDWCISRQLWWGHRIPVFYCDACGEVWASMEDPEACRACGAGDVRQDPDVLDTWFSSQLWPFSTLGWPERTPDLDYFYPTSVLVTGYEIIHLWVARMIMSGLHFMGDVPFRQVYVHGIVRDAQGRKMSKSLGNVVDPLELMDRYGTDALRYTLAEHATGQDIFLHEEWIAGSRNFANKIWNAARFALMNLEPGEEPGPLPRPERLTVADRWIVSRLARTAAEVGRNLDGLEVADAARALYAFTWGEFCDWYIEVSKLRFRSDDAAVAAGARAVLVHVLDRVLRLLHLFMPFITDEIWQKLPGNAGRSVMVAEWPRAEGEPDQQAEAEFGRVREVVVAIRSFRADHKVDPRSRLTVHLSSADPAALAILDRERETVALLAGLEAVDLDGAPAGGPAARLATSDVEVLVPLAGVLDLDAERGRIRREVEKVRGEIAGIDAKLSSRGFLTKAPPEVVEAQRRRLDEARASEGGLLRQLEEIGG